MLNYYLSGMVFGAVISLLTFPGIILKIILEKVYVKALRIEQVEAEEGKEDEKKLEYKFTLPSLVGKLLAQFLVLSLLSLALNYALKLVDPLMQFGEENMLATILWWLGLSFAVHSFPTLKEGKFAWKKAGEKSSRVGKGLWYFTALVLFGLSVVEYFWGSILYGIGLYWLVRLFF